MLIESQSQLRESQRIEFCYLCGHPLELAPCNRDHVPPKRMFAVEDRLNPLVLPTHERCNHHWHAADEQTCDLFSLFNGREFGGRNQPSLQVVSLKEGEGDTPYLATSSLNLIVVVRRWIHAFHTALYREFLPLDTPMDIGLPFPSSDTPDFEALSGLRHLHEKISWKLLNHRLMNRVDRIRIYNSKCDYFCVWSKMDSGKSCCMFALRVHSWENLVDTRLGPKAACMGLYIPVAGRPEAASKAVEIELVRPGRPVWNPF